MTLSTVRNRLLESRERGDQGITLIEQMVVIVLLSIVLTIAMSAFQASSKVFNSTNDDSTGLADARKVSERMGRDIRNARGIDTGATTSKLVIWIDTNSDYRRQAAESITWELQANGDGVHYDVIRKVGTTEQIVEARSLVSQIAFTYDVAAPNTKVVTAEVTYDAYVGVGSATRTLYFVERLRNVDDQA